MIVFDKRLKKCPIKSCQGDAYYEQNNTIDRITTIRITCQKCGLSAYKQYVLLTDSKRDIVKDTIEYWNDR